MTSFIDELRAGLSDPAWGRRVDALRTVAAKLAAGDVAEADEGGIARLVLAAAHDAKWEVQKAAAVAMSELRYAEPTSIDDALRELALNPTHYVKEAAERALKRFRSRAQRQKEWKVTETARDPTLHHIMKRIREIGLRSMTPAHIYDLAIEVSEQSYREVAADTAHELNNILAPFEGYLVDLEEHLSTDASDIDAAKQLVVLARSRLEHLSRLIDDLAEYSTPSAADFSPTHLEAVVREAVAIGADRGGHTSADDSSPTVNHVIEVAPFIVLDALSDRLTRAVTNLVANAYQAMASGGTLTIRAEVTGADRVRLTVEDTGRGMTPEEVEHARVRFKSNRRADGGTGLGLPIAERIVVDDHRGELQIVSTPGRGTAITMTLPLCQNLDGDP